ncbi:MAG: hypothetical protein LAT81_06165, partial [Oceanicaulis sp.]|nr:hypothetical protein [Oceanicaulis sp.]
PAGCLCAPCRSHGGLMPARGRSGGREVIFEFTTLGQSTRVAAVDVATGEEVVISGPAGASRGDLERVALRKLLRRLSRTLSADSKKTPRRGGRGVVV